jgi:hypothetical protein
MNTARRGFIASFFTWLTAIPFVRAFAKKPKSFDFHVRIEEIGEERYRAILNCGNKQAIIESPIFGESHPVTNWAHCARFGILCEATRAMKLLAFPADKEMWMSPVWHWFDESPTPHEPLYEMNWKKPNGGRDLVSWQCSAEEQLARAKTYNMFQQLTPDGKLNIRPDLS